MAMLPVVKYKGKEYYVDQRLRQIRNVDNPHDWLDLDNLSIIASKGSDPRLKQLFKDITAATPMNPRDNEKYFPPDKYPQTRPSKKVSMKAKKKNAGESMLDRAMKSMRK